MRDDAVVRTTLDLDMDILLAAKELAAVRKLTAGQVISELVRKALTIGRETDLRNGVPLIARKAGSPPLTMADVNRLRDE